MKYTTVKNLLKLLSEPENYLISDYNKYDIKSRFYEILYNNKKLKIFLEYVKEDINTINDFKDKKDYQNTLKQLKIMQSDIEKQMEKNKLVQKHKPELLIIIGGSGSGKTTLAKNIIKNIPKSTLIISDASRKPRENEIEEKDYYFVTPKEIQKEENYINKVYINPEKTWGYGIKENEIKSGFI